MDRQRNTRCSVRNDSFCMQISLRDQKPSPWAFWRASAKSHSLSIRYALASLWFILRHSLRKSSMTSLWVRGLTSRQPPSYRRHCCVESSTAWVQYSGLTALRSSCGWIYLSRLAYHIVNRSMLLLLFLVSNRNNRSVRYKTKLENGFSSLRMINQLFTTYSTQPVQYYDC